MSGHSMSAPCLRTEAAVIFEIKSNMIDAATNVMVGLLNATEGAALALPLRAAKVQFLPAMNAEDLKWGLDDIAAPSPYFSWPREAESAMKLKR